MTRPSTIERALEIARSGEVEKVEHIRKRLKREGYTDFDWHVSGAAFKRQLLAAIAAARGEPR